MSEISSWARRRVVLCPPAIVVPGSDPFTSTAHGFLVRMSPRANEAMFRHEMWHVWQFWVLTIAGAVLALLGHAGAYMAGLYHMVPGSVIPAGAGILTALPNILFSRIPYLSWRKEVAAYARSVRYGRSIESAAYALASRSHKLYRSYRWDRDECYKAIAARVERRWWGGYALF